ncbi:MAG: GFA family protein [Polyangiaceae bacterium]
MSESLSAREGGCRCGAVRLAVRAMPLLTMACHCRGCQRMSSSAYSLSAAIPTDGFVVLQGDPVVGGLKGASRHMFCPECMTWMFTRPEGMDWFVNLRPTLLDDASWFAPFLETYTSTRLAFAVTGAVHAFETFPPFEQYESLTRDYAARGSKPR